MNKPITAVSLWPHECGRAAWMNWSVRNILSGKENCCAGR